MSVLLNNVNLNSVNCGPGDPFYPDVQLLLHFNGSAGSTTITDNSRFVRTPGLVKPPCSINTSIAKFNQSCRFTGGYMWYNDDPGFHMGAGDFTIECWAYFAAGSLDNRVILYGKSDSIGGQSPYSMLRNAIGQVAISGYFDDGTTYGLSSVNVTAEETWYHIAQVRSGSDFYLFVNGQLWASTNWTKTLVDSTYKLAVGAAGENMETYGGEYGTMMMGYLDDFRITKGVARYTAPFTPPTSPFPNF